MGNNVVDYKNSLGVEYNDEVSQKQIINGEDKLYMFFSFDICNSTGMKSELSNWEDVIFCLHNTPFLNLNIWKFLGDEVIFCCPYCGISGFVNMIKAAYEQVLNLENILSEVANGYKVKIKGALWLAYVSESGNNKGMQIKDTLEFVGKQIDEGFRMSQYSSEGKLLLDPKVVYCILYLFCIDAAKISTNSKFDVFAKEFLNGMDENAISKAVNLLSGKHMLTGEISELVKGIRFIKYEHLSGIWGEKPYPIYWYYDQAGKIQYYESVSGEPQSILIESDPYNMKMFFSKNLFGIFQSVQVDNEVTEILNVIIEDKIFTPYLSSAGSKLYYSIACVKDNHVLVVQRSNNRKHLRGVWEFGFQKYTNADSIEIVQNYLKTELGIDVELYTDETDENNIIPLHFCNTYRNSNKHVSVLCCAKILSDSSIEELEKSINKHIDCRNSNGKTNPDYISAYKKARFITEDIAKSEFQSLTLRDIEEDSYKAKTGSQLVYNDTTNIGEEKQQAILYFAESAKAAIVFSNLRDTHGYDSWADIFAHPNIASS